MSQITNNTNQQYINNLKCANPLNEKLVVVYEDLFAKGQHSAMMSESDHHKAKIDQIYAKFTNGKSVSGKSEIDFANCTNEELSTYYRELCFIKEISVIQTIARKNYENSVMRIIEVLFEKFILLISSKNTFEHEKNLTEFYNTKLDVIDKASALIDKLEEKLGISNKINFNATLDPTIGEYNFFTLKTDDDHLGHNFYTDEKQVEIKKHNENRKDNFHKVEKHTIELDSGHTDINVIEKHGNTTRGMKFNSKNEIGKGSAKHVFRADCYKVHFENGPFIEISDVAILLNRFEKQAHFMKADLDSKQMLSNCGVKTAESLGNIVFNEGENITIYAAETLYTKGSLDVFMKSEEFEKLNPASKKEIAKSLLEGLAKYHNLKLIHRDIKPGNLLIDDNNKVVLTDFPELTSTAQGPKVTKSIPTIDYSPPGVFNSQLDNDGEKQSADIWAAGMCLFAIIYGQKLWGVVNPSEFPPPRQMNRNTDMPKFHANIASFILAMESSGDTMDVDKLACKDAETIKKYQAIKKLVNSDRKMWDLIKSMLEPRAEKRPTAAKLLDEEAFKPIKQEKSAKNSAKLAGDDYDW